MNKVTISVEYLRNAIKLLRDNKIQPINGKYYILRTPNGEIKINPKEMNA